MNLLGAFQFLTVLPIRSSSSQSGPAALWFPLVGALLGLAAATPCVWLPAQGPLLALALVALLTGGLHEDGLADVCDALRAHRSREKMLAILHDSRIGAHGAAGFVFSLLIRWQALGQIHGDLWLRLPAAYAFSRGAMVLMAAVLPAVGEGLGRHFKNTLPRSAVVLVALQCAGLCYVLGPIVLAAQVLLLAIAGRWFYSRLGGATGDCLGFTCQLSEATSLVVLAAL